MRDNADKSVGPGEVSLARFLKFFGFIIVFLGGIVPAAFKNDFGYAIFGMFAGSVILGFITHEMLQDEARIKQLTIRERP